ncbi:hypothetical protein M1615_04675 [Patescibacteria group bacterium]|nr:hypothetical protein [Patescibacteria group bacterium]MCL5010199.1 hypothetical protein [Patescibacteria group bacterium]
MRFRRIEILLFFIAFVLFFAKAAFLLDPDFGWSLEMGRLISLHGIPKTDPFSYTMPSYPYVDHEWLADLAIAKLYPAFGMVGLSVISALFLVLALVFSVSRAGFAGRKFGLIPTLLAVLILFPFAFFRVQVVTWFFFSLLIFIILDEKHFMRFRFFIPGLFLLWANLHGGFAAGIAALLIVVLSRAWNKHRLSIGDFAVFLASLAATLINPYGLRLWWEVWMLMSDSSIHWTISEWMPSLFFLNPAFWIFAVLSLIAVFRYMKKFKAPELALYFMFLVFSLSSLKQIPLWIIIALPMTISCFFWFYREVLAIQYGGTRFLKAYRVLFLIIAVFVIIQRAAGFIGSGIFKAGLTYPRGAVLFLRNQPKPLRIFSTYGWGGYLIWKLPGDKLFIDGRMPDWRRNAPVKNESNNAMKEYEKIESGKESFAAAVKKYHIDTVLLPRQNKHQPFRKGLTGPYQNLEAFIVNLTGAGDRTFDLEKELKKEGWRRVYKDGNSVVYRLD